MSINSKSELIISKEKELSNRKLVSLAIFRFINLIVRTRRVPRQPIAFFVFVAVIILQIVKSLKSFYQGHKFLIISSHDVDDIFVAIVEIRQGKRNVIALAKKYMGQVGLAQQGVRAFRDAGPSI